VILILSDEAVLDIEEAFIWYFEINPSIADKFENTLFTELEHIQTNSENFQTRYKNKGKISFKIPLSSKNPTNWFDCIK